MATSPRTIELQPDAYDLVVREAERRGVEPDTLVDELVRTDLGRQENGDLKRGAERARRVHGRAAADRRGRTRA